MYLTLINVILYKRNLRLGKFNCVSNITQNTSDGNHYADPGLSESFTLAYLYATLPLLTCTLTCVFLEDQVLELAKKKVNTENYP